MRSFANASAISGDWKWSEMNYVVQRGPGIIKVATEHKPLLHSVLSQTFHHLTVCSLSSLNCGYYSTLTGYFVHHIRTHLFVLLQQSLKFLLHRLARFVQQYIHNRFKLRPRKDVDLGALH